MKINLKSAIYPLEAIRSTCYAFIDRAYIFLDMNPKNDDIVVSLKGKKKVSQQQMKSLAQEFMNELLCCALRYQIGTNNKKIREYIIGRALYSTLPNSNLNSLSENPGNQEDPLGIALPWEKKYGKKRRSYVLKV